MEYWRWSNTRPRLLLLMLVLFMLDGKKQSLALNNNPLLLLISLDGFRYDLLNATLVPNIWNLAQQGVYFKQGIKPQYLSYTLPNHVSISTGLLAQHHGIVGNVFNDPVSGQMQVSNSRFVYCNQYRFDLFNETGQIGIVNRSLSQRFYNGEPIWLTNERAGNGRRSASMFWPSGEASWPSPPHKPSLSKSWVTGKTLSDWKADFDEIVDLFTRSSEPYNFIAWYIAEPDHTLHVNGFRNGEIVKTLSILDSLFNYVTSKLREKTELAQKLNIILTADHGHAEIESPSNIFCLSEFISLDGLKFGDHMFDVGDDKRKRLIYETLKEAIKKHHYGIKIYYKEELPKIYGYAQNSRVGDIIVEPEPGFTVHPRCSHEMFQQKYAAPGSFHMSAHGADPNHWTMRAILVMIGPSFKHNYQVNKVANNIDIYSLMCYILRLLPAPNNGTLNHLREVLEIPKSYTSPPNEMLKILIVVVTCGVLPLIFLVSAIAILCGNGETLTSLLQVNDTPRYQRLFSDMLDEKLVIGHPQLNDFNQNEDQLHLTFEDEL